jgi:membrane protein
VKPTELPTVLEAGGTEITTAAGGARTHRKPLKAFRWRDLVSILNSSLGEWNKHKVPRLGASLAFYTLLSIAPLQLVLVSVVGLVLGHNTAQADIIARVQSLVGGQGAAAAQVLLEGSRNSTHGIVATAFGLILLLFGASGVLIELRDALNTIWEVPTPELSRLQQVIGIACSGDT